MKTAHMLRQQLELIFQWYGGMVNPRTGMFEYLYLPQQDSLVQERCSRCTSRICLVLPHRIFITNDH